MKIQSSVAQIFHYIFARQLLLAGKLTIMIGIGFFSRSYNAEFLSQSFEVLNFFLNSQSGFSVSPVKPLEAFFQFANLAIIITVILLVVECFIIYVAYESFQLLYFFSTLCFFV